MLRYLPIKGRLSFKLTSFIHWSMESQFRLNSSLKEASLEAKQHVGFCTWERE